MQLLFDLTSDVTYQKVIKCLSSWQVAIEKVFLRFMT